MTRQVSFVGWYTLPVQTGGHGISQVPRHLSSCVPRSTTPAGPPGSHHERSFCVGFRIRNAVATCIYVRYEAQSLRGRARSPTAHRILCVRFVRIVRQFKLSHSALLHNEERCIDPFDFLLCIRNTRYGWLVRPYPARTLTSQEMPGFPWRTPVGTHTKDR